MSDEQDRAEAIDDDVVDSDEFDEEPPGDFPPDRPMGVDDIGAADLLDDVRTRAEREEPEWPASARGDTAEMSAEMSAEESAMHEIDP